MQEVKGVQPQIQEKEKDFTLLKEKYDSPQKT